MASMEGAGLESTSLNHFSRRWGIGLVLSGIWP